MQVFEDLKTVTLQGNTVLTFGAFDGVHLGHQSVIGRVVESARTKSYRSAVFSFYPHPKRFLDPENCPPCLTARDKKISLIKALGVDMLLLVRLETWLSQLSPLEFIEEITYRQLNARHIIVGYDSEFGYKRQGNAQVLQEIVTTLGITADIVPPQSVCGGIVSSTLVRQAIGSAGLELATCMLGRHHSVLGRVVVGQQLGRQLGFPTANLDTEDQMLPPNGVYAVHARLHQQSFPAVLNIGLRPTFGGMSLQVEAHLLGFDGDVYGELMELEFVKRIRDEQKFANVDTLIAQVKRDIATARRVLEP